ncbi:MAG: transcription termination/antitermination protein NusA [Dehalococcoidia bacterium]|nr:transcription termination/antitermination protein NusA [Dehalococcoidia bacterium]
MKTEFMAAITQLSSERNLPREVILEAIEAALVSAYKKEVFIGDQEVAVKIDAGSGDIHVFLVKTIVDEVTNPDTEVTLANARKIRRDVAVGDTIEIESTPQGAGRIAAQIARQVVLQRLREAEHHATFEQFVGKEGEVVTGTVQFAQPTAVFVTIGRREAILPSSEQLPNERYHQGQQLRFYLLQASHEGRNPRVMLSRSHPNLVRRLFEIEIPEVHGGIVEVRAVARDPGQRSKVAVSSRQEAVEPVGSCLGPRGIRLQSIVNHLNGEKVDVVEWHPDPRVFIANALSPAQVAHIALDEPARTAIVVVPDKQLSLAIGRGGQNARLAAKLTGWRIDIKSTSAAEAEMGSLPEPLSAVAPTQSTTPGGASTEAGEAPPVLGSSATVEASTTSDADTKPQEITADEKGALEIENVEEIAVTEEEEPVEGETLEQLLASEVFRFEEDSGKGSLSVLRFAEDILPGGRRGGKNDKSKSKKKKRTSYGEETDDPA